MRLQGRKTRGITFRVPLGSQRLLKQHHIGTHQISDHGFRLIQRPTTVGIDLKLHSPTG